MLKPAHHDRAVAIGRHPHVREAAVRDDRLGGFGGRKRPTVFGRDAALQRRHDLFRLGDPAALRQPPRALGQHQPDPPHPDGRDGPDQHDPAPSVDPEGRRRHQQIGQNRHDRHGRETDRLATRESASTQALRREFTEIGADRHHLEAEPDPSDEAPDIEAEGRGLQRHDDVGGGVPQQ